MKAGGIQTQSMRQWWACFVAAVILVAASATPAAVTGRVASIGFQSFIRLSEWTPMVVQISSDEPAPHTYDLQVIQNDLDGDAVVYTRRGITVNPGNNTFRTYFRPETANGGLPASGTDPGNELAKRLRVVLYDPDTRKAAVRLSVAGALPQALEHGELAPEAAIGQKLVLVVGRSPSTIELAPGRERVVGLAESIFFVTIDPIRLPESALAYGGVDAVVWTDADAAALAPVQLRALRQYVQGGGTLAVIQHNDLTRTSAFADLLPVKAVVPREWQTPEPLQSILQPRGEPPPRDKNGRIINAWERATPPYRMADAEAADATTFVEAWTNWPDGHRSPLIARRLFGLGCVAWLAEDVSDPSLANVSFGWPRLWQRLFDWRDNDLRFGAALSDADLKTQQARYAFDNWRDLGGAFVRGTDLDSRTAAYVTVVFVFFVGYWLLAGPGSFAFLAMRKQTQLSWLVYGAIATGAIVLTVLIAQLLLRGDATARHVSVIRTRPGEPARVQSRVGIYLPKDTTAAVALPQTPNLPPAAIAPLSIEPALGGDKTINPRDSGYDVVVSTDTDVTAVEVGVPFRTTLKKLQADWTGTVTGSITGLPRLENVEQLDKLLSGRLSNDTGADLRDVIIVFRSPFQRRDDEVITLPEWKAGQTIDLASVWKSADVALVPLPSKRSGLPLYSSKPMRGRWSDACTALYEDLRASMTTLSGPVDDSDSGYPRSFPIISLFTRCPTMNNIGNQQDRVSVLRRGTHSLDVSPAVAAGAMVILAKSSVPIPLAMPLTVDGDTPKNDGATLFQAIVPLDRSAFTAPDAKDPDSAL